MSKRRERAAVFGGGRQKKHKGLKRCVKDWEREPMTGEGDGKKGYLFAEGELFVYAKQALRSTKVTVMRKREARVLRHELSATESKRLRKRAGGVGGNCELPGNGNNLTKELQFQAWSDLGYSTSQERSKSSGRKWRRAQSTYAGETIKSHDLSAGGGVRTAAEKKVRRIREKRHQCGLDCITGLKSTTKIVEGMQRVEGTKISIGDQISDIKMRKAWPRRGSPRAEQNEENAKKRKIS